MEDQELKLCLRHYGQLVGKTVRRVVYDNACGMNTFGLEFRDGTIAWILCDPEGNGPGHLDILERQPGVSAAPTKAGRGITPE